MSFLHFSLFLLLTFFHPCQTTSLKCFTSSELSSSPYTSLSKPANRYGATITLERDGWAGHWVTTTLASILLEELMGYNISINDQVGGYDGYQRLATEFEGANFEVWPDSEGIIKYQTWITQKGAVVDAGTLGVTGRSGWYVPSYVVDQYPQFGPDFWRFYSSGIANALQVFDHAGTTPDELLVGTGRSFVPPECVAETSPPGCPVNEEPYFNRECNVTKYKPCIELLAIDGWYDPGILQQQVRSNNMSIVIPFLGETNFYDRIQWYLDRKKPVLFYYWTPADFIAHNSFTRVALRDPTPECYSDNQVGFTGNGSVNCDFRTQTLIKTYSGTLKNDARNDDFRNFISQFKLATEAQLEILSQMSTDNSILEATSFTATCTWIKQNFYTWSSWISNHEIRILQPNEQLGVVWDDSIRTLSLALSVLGTWTTLILVEQSIFLKVKGERYVPWLMLSTVGQGMCGIWTMHLAGLTAFKLGPGGTVDYIFPRFIPWEAVVSIFIACSGVLFAFLLMLSHRTFRVEASDGYVVQTSRNSSGYVDLSVSSSEKQDDIIQPPLIQRFMTECHHLYTKCDWRMFIAGILMTSSVVGTYFMAYDSVKMAAKMTLNGGGVVGAIAVAYFGSCFTLLLTFHLRGTWRYATALIMGLTVFGMHNIIASGITYQYIDKYQESSTTWNSDTVRLLVSISTAVTCLVFIGLNVSRLKLSRNEMEQEIQTNQKQLQRVEAKLIYEKKARRRDYQRIHELSRQIEFINMCRPINRSHAIALAAKHKADIVDGVSNENSVTGATTGTSPEGSIIPHAGPSTSTPSTPAHVALKMDPTSTTSHITSQSHPSQHMISPSPTHKMLAPSQQQRKRDSMELMSTVTSHTEYHKEEKPEDTSPVESPKMGGRDMGGRDMCMGGRDISRASDLGLPSMDGPSPDASPPQPQRLRPSPSTLVTDSPQQHQPPSSPSASTCTSQQRMRTQPRITNPTLLQIVNNPVTLELLKDQMVSDHTVESLMLYLDIQKYKSIGDSNLRKQLAPKIFDTFLSETSQHQVNVSSRMRSEVAKKISKGAANCFLHVETEMFSLISSNTMGRFRASERWVMALVVLNTPSYTDRSIQESSHHRASATTSEIRDTEYTQTAQPVMSGIVSNEIPGVVSMVSRDHQEDEETIEEGNAPAPIAPNPKRLSFQGSFPRPPAVTTSLYDEESDGDDRPRVPPSPSLVVAASPSTFTFTASDMVPISELEGGLGVPASSTSAEPNATTSTRDV